MRTCFTKSASERKRDRDRLNNLAEHVLKEVPGTALASDQDYRVADLAIDFCEDVPPLSWDDVRKIQRILEEKGATTKVSSIHVNAWFGSYDKLTMTRKCLKDLFAIDMDEANDQILFTGDSPNDSPMFAYFNNSVGMANIRNFELPVEPAYVTELPDASGFTSVAKAIIKSRTVKAT
jgi:hydroxymethylpyrimidine pyrophosphatase-like HAD family hydrolase